MRSVYEQIAQVACANTTVLISGESGTGKELVAHALHVNSPRAEGPFVKVSCAGLPEDLIDSELFGHEPGAFTDAFRRHAGRFERANGGTLFLDEVSELTQSVQLKLLRVLQTREFERVGGNETISVDVRLIVATNRPLEKEMTAGRFRSDLYYRLHIFPISIPTLRERKEDIPLLVRYFIDRLKKERKRRGRDLRVSPVALKWMLEYEWPGNVRELQNAIECAFVMAEGDVIHHYHLPEPMQRAFAPGVAASIDLFEAVAEYERDLICHTLRRTRGKRNQAAKLLHLSERTLAYKLRKHAIDHVNFRKR